MTDGQDPTVTDDGTLDGNADELTVDELKAELAKVRREAAARRVANKEKEKELEEFQKWKDSQKTELEKANDRAAKAEAVAAQAAKEKLQRKVAKATGLDPDLADRLIGDTEEELLEDAKALAQRYKPAGGAFTAAGRRGAPVAPGGPSASSVFNAFVRGQG